MNFDHLELLNVWGRYKSTQGESCEDKLDRLGKIVGNLRSTTLIKLSQSKDDNWQGEGSDRTHQLDPSPRICEAAAAERTAQNAE